MTNSQKYYRRRKEHKNAIYVVLCTAFVRAAIHRGDIPKASTLECVDCGAPAFCYDHRDYWKPLHIVPVCSTCNIRRGAGAHGVAKSATHVQHVLFARRRPDVIANYLETDISSIMDEFA